MDEKALEYTRDHYNKHAVPTSYEKVPASVVTLALKLLRMATTDNDHEFL